MKKMDVFAVILLAAFTVALSGCVRERVAVSEDTYSTVEAFAKENGLKMKDYPDELLLLLDRNPEAEEFVLNYPLKKDSTAEIDMSRFDGEGVPLFLQWDEAWGYEKYGDSIIGLAGCGPTCLAMVCYYFKGGEDCSPKSIAEFSEKNGWYVDGVGSSWELISSGSAKLGLRSEELPLDENRLRRELEKGNPVICSMGKGDFTTTGHFIVMTDYVDGKIKVNDPNSVLRSEKLWDYDAISEQIRNLWVIYAE